MYRLADFEAHARSVLDKNTWEYYSSGAYPEQTLRDNVDAFMSYRIRPRFLRDVSKVDISTHLLGTEVAFPVGVSPTAAQCMAHPEGEAGTAKACAHLGTCMILGAWSNTSLEDVAKASGSGLRWFQQRIYTDREFTVRLIRKAEAAGFKALVITMDYPALVKSPADARNQLVLPKELSFPNFTSAQSGQESSEPHASKCPKVLNDPTVTWEDIGWVCSITQLPVIVKGLVTAEDALEAVKYNIKGILVSNHGARTLDGLPATIDALPEIVEAVQGKVDVFLDGGVRKGTDVLKALAMGAKAVFVGRPALWGLAYKGSKGVEELLGLLRDEFRQAMTLSGCAKLSDIKPEIVVHESYYKSRR